MKKIVLFMLLFLPFSVFALEYPSVNSKYVEIYDVTDGKVLYEKNSTEQISIASLTKIATTITAIETIDNLDKHVTITKDILSTVRWDASIAGLKDGDNVTYRDLLFASMLPSGADATNSIAILTSGSVENFVERMNSLAKRIGLSNTHFVNVTGLDSKEHYSTASDVVKLLEYSLKNETFRNIFVTKEYTLTNGLKVYSTIKSYSKAMDINIDKILGSKTGFTQGAMYCLTTLINKDGHDIIVSNFYANHVGNNFYHIIDNDSLINFLYSNYNNQTLISENTIIKELPVEISNIDKYEIYSSEIQKFLPNDYNKDLFKIEYNGIEKLSFTNKKGDNIGTIKYYYDNELIKEEEVILNTEIKFDIIKIIKKYYIYIFCLFILITSIFVVIIRKNVLKKSLNKRTYIIL